MQQAPQTVVAIALGNFQNKIELCNCSRVHSSESAVPAHNAALHWLRTNTQTTRRHCQSPPLTQGRDTSNNRSWEVGIWPEHVSAHNIAWFFILFVFCVRCTQCRRLIISARATHRPTLRRRRVRHFCVFYHKINSHAKLLKWYYGHMLVVIYFRWSRMDDWPELNTF